MERISIEELQQHTYALLARVARGEVLEITVDGHPVARAEPIDSPSDADR